MSSSQVSQPPASRLLLGARLPENAAPVDVMLRGGFIDRVVPAGQGERTAETQVWELDGRYLIPGLWDAHVHFSQWAMARRRFDASAAESAAALANMVGELLRSRGDSREQLVGFGFRDGLWPDAPSRELLDSVSADIPVVAVSADLHCCWLNSAALRLYGHDQHPTGLLREEDCFALQQRLGEVPDEVLDGWVAEAASEAASRGVVGVTDLEMSWGFDHWRRRVDLGFRSLRVQVGVYRQDLDRAISLGMRTGDALNELISVGPFKLITDGSLNTRTAYCHEPYFGQPGHAAGQLNLSVAEITELISRASRSGIVPAVHAIGDKANTIVLDAFEYTGAVGRIEHAQLLRTEDVARFARLGVSASVQPRHALDDQEMIDSYWPDRSHRAFLLRSLHEAGVTLLLGSDAPVAPLDPWVTLAAASDAAGVETEEWGRAQGLERRVALAASTHGHPGIVQGAVADLVVIERDPFDLGARLLDMPVAATLIAGNPTFLAAAL